MSMRKYAKVQSNTGIEEQHPLSRKLFKKRRKKALMFNLSLKQHFRFHLQPVFYFVEGETIPYNFSRGFPGQQIWCG